jgi:hypothetical protein
MSTTIRSNGLATIAGLAASLALYVACHPKPPPPPPPPPPVVEAPPPPPPPPPKCEALSEGCTGQTGTVARIRKSGLGIAVPQGWTYAQQDDATVVNTAAASFVVTTYDAGADAKATAANRDAAFDALVRLLGVTPPKHKVNWAHAAKKSKVGALEISLWQADDVTRADKKGPVLVFGGTLPDKSLLLGAGFVAEDDKTDADKAILASIDSIAALPADASAPASDASTAPSAAPASGASSAAAPASSAHP